MSYQWRKHKSRGSRGGAKRKARMDGSKRKPERKSPNSRPRDLYSQCMADQRNLVRKGIDGSLHVFTAARAVEKMPWWWAGGMTRDPIGLGAVVAGRDDALRFDLSKCVAHGDCSFVKPVNEKPPQRYTSHQYYFDGHTAGETAAAVLIIDHLMTSFTSSTDGERENVISMTVVVFERTLPVRKICECIISFMIDYPPIIQFR